MIALNLDPVLIDLGFMQIRYYGLIYVIGFLTALFILLRVSKKGHLNITTNKVYDFVFYSIIGLLVGARLFHVIFWNFSHFIENPLRILYFWEGGLSFHGGLLGLAITLYILCKKNNLKLAKLADILTIPLLLILAIGRVANFINQELLGTITNLPWCVKFIRADPENCRHPIQLYGALGRFILFLILLKFPKPKKDGFIFWNFVALIGIGRLIIDFLREDIRYIGLSSGQWLSIIMLILGLYVLTKYYKEDLRTLFL